MSVPCNTAEKVHVQHWVLPTSPLYKWEILILIWIEYFLHQGDRQIFNTIIPLIRSSLGLNDIQLGQVSTVFSLVYGLLVPIAGFLGDFLPRKWILVSSLLIFSTGTLLSGISTGVVSLILFRSIATGAGEAFFYPSATSLLAQFHEKTRALALGILQTALYIGITLSGLIAGYIGEHWGWRQAFFTFGSAGVIWTFVISCRLRNTPQPVIADAMGRNGRFTSIRVLNYIAHRPSAWLLALAFGSMVYVNLGYLTWSSTYLHERYKLTLAQAGFQSMVYHHFFAFIGVLVGGRITDCFARAHPAIRMKTAFCGLLLSVPFIYWLGCTSTLNSFYIAASMFGLFRGLYDSNSLAALFDVVEPRMRASAAGLMLSFGFVAGSVSPVILGWMKTYIGLASGLKSLAWFYLFGAICIGIAIKFFFRRDYIPSA